MKLYEIEQQYRDIADQLEYAEAPEGVYLTLNELQALREHKLDAICTLIKEARLEAAAVKTEADNLRNRAKVAENLEARLIAYIEMCLTPGETFANERHKIGWRASEAVEVFDESKLPEEFWTVPAPAVSKSKIKDALKGGAVVPGAKIDKRNNLQVK